MERTPRLMPVHEPRDPEAVALVLHGGASRPSSPMVSPTQLSVLRMVPIAKRVAHEGGRRLAVYRLLNSTRGWDTTHTPVDDAHWALDEIASRLGRELPAGLVGHSLGGRAAILASNHDHVRSVVALNPWVYPSDGQGRFGGRDVLIVHGDADRIASIKNAEAVARGISRTALVGFVTVRGGKHAMLRRGGVFSKLAADFTVSTLLGDEPTGTLADVRREGRVAV